MQFGLKEHTIEKIKQVFIKYPQIEKVVIYGSRAKGNYKTGSDIDLTIKGKEINLSLLNKLENELDDLFLPYTFDISIYKHIKNKSLIEHIERLGLCFFEKIEGEVIC